MQNIISSLLSLIGITQPPQTISELIWDIVLLLVSLLIIKYICLAVFGLMKHITKM